MIWAISTGTHFVWLMGKAETPYCWGMFGYTIISQSRVWNAKLERRQQKFLIYKVVPF